MRDVDYGDPITHYEERSWMTGTAVPAGEFVRVRRLTRWRRFWRWLLRLRG
jgi:hypothetical protein